jgi:GT2 family glycosyltransferase
MEFAITIISSMYNRSLEVLEVIDKLFLPSLLENGGADRELILIDDCSPLKIETEAIIRKHLPELERRFGKVVFAQSETNRGFAGSFNKGLVLAHGKKIIITNDDVYFPPGSVGKLATTLDEQAGCLIVGPITNASTAWSFQYCRQAPTIKSYEAEEIAKLTQFSKRLAAAMAGRRMATDNICGFCFAADTNFLRLIGGFDENYAYGFFEDTDLIQRVAREFGAERIAINLAVFVGHGGIKGSSRSMLQHPLKAQLALIINGIKYANRWGWGKLLRRVIFGTRSQLTGKGTISEFISGNEVVSSYLLAPETEEAK